MMENPSYHIIDGDNLLYAYCPSIIVKSSLSFFLRSVPVWMRNYILTLHWCFSAFFPIIVPLRSFFRHLFPNHPLPLAPSPWRFNAGGILDICLCATAFWRPINHCTTNHPRFFHPPGTSFDITPIETDALHKWHSSSVISNSGDVTERSIMFTISSLKFSPLGFAFSYLFFYPVDFSLSLSNDVTFFSYFLNKEGSPIGPAFQNFKEGAWEDCLQFGVHSWKFRGNTGRRTCLFSFLVVILSLIFQDWGAHQKSQRMVKLAQWHLGYCCNCTDQPSLCALSTHHSQEKIQWGQCITDQRHFGHIRGKWPALCSSYTLAFGLST